MAVEAISDRFAGTLQFAQKQLDPTKSAGPSLLSQGEDGSALIADRGASKVEIRFVGNVREDSERWAELARRCALSTDGRLESPAIRKVIAHSLEGDEPTVTLAAAHVSLATWLSNRSAGSIDADFVVKIIEPIAFALGRAHRLSIVHGGLSPETVWIDDADAPSIEFTGLRVAPRALRWSSSCAAPELISPGAQPDAASDIYALGVVALGLLIGGDPTEQLEKSRGKLNGSGLRALFDAAVSVEPADRPTAAEFSLALREWVQIRSSKALRGALPVKELPRRIELEAGARLGRFRLVDQLGIGGMGEVWKAIDDDTYDTVALKVMHTEIAKDATFLRRFRKEARTLAAVRNRFVANMIEINSDADRHYLVMEFVEGRSVSALLEERGTIDEKQALAIVADACHALIEPHRTGLVHRDIKPDNMMFVQANEALADQDFTRQRIKLCDFGIARETSDNATANTQLTQHGVLIGTPAYMAPEQCRGGSEFVPATDVYALGVTLFELIAGRLPFLGATPMDMIVAQLSSDPPSLRELQPSVSDATVAIVERCLAKDASMRFSDARSLLDAIELALFGDRSKAVAHPTAPVTQSKKTKRFVFEWELDASPRELWPYVSNTDKMNRAAGLAPVRYQLQGLSKGVSKRIGANSALGIKLVWNEHPYEWIENRRHAVLREFQTGPVEWYSAEVELEPAAGGKTRVRHRITLHPRNFLGSLAAPFEIGIKYRRALNKAYRRLEALLVQGRTTQLPSGLDLLQPTVKLARGGDELLHQAARRVIALGFDTAIVTAVCGYLRVASDSDVARVRPYELADELSLHRDRVAEVCFALASEGAMVLLWDVICPSCKIAMSVADSLAAVKSHGECAACNMSFDLDFSKSIEVVFRPHPSVRTVETRTYCAGGPGHFPHVLAQLRLAPGEQYELPLSLVAGRYRLRSAQIACGVDLVVRPGLAARRADVALSADAPETTVALSEGSQTIVITNSLSDEMLIRLERTTHAQHALTAAKASSMRVFRELFGEQVLAPDALFTVASMTLVSTMVDDSVSLLRAKGDNAGYALVLSLVRLIDEIVGRFGGALLKTVGSRTVCAFENTASAVEAVFAIRAALAERPALAALGVRIAVHRGSMVAATIGDRLDYFGRNAEAAFALPSELAASSMLLTQTVVDDAAVRELLKARTTYREPRRLRSLGGDAWGVEVR